jgi:site-specific DNA-methyltransferase (adenine-specific)
MTLSKLALRNRNPDVLECIANLSSDEVFTPPSLANHMLDSVAEAWSADNDGADIWSDPNVTFLDPCTKSGVFLREIATRLIQGLATQMPDLQERVEHILTKQVFGIGITQLTSLLARRSLYCSKHANGDHSVVKSFDDGDGNIWFEPTEHTWKSGRCTYCGASEGTYSRGGGQESHAYKFIHTDKVKNIGLEVYGKQMQFDVVIGNPPYQLGSDGGTRDIPIYHHFVEQAKQLNAKFITMVIPARWMATGLGLSEFRKTMLSDKHIKQIVSYPTAREVFPGVDIKGGVCYFLRSSNHNGECEVTTIRGKEEIGPFSRDLNEFDVFVRDSRAISILRKVLKNSAPSINTILARDKEFGRTSNYDDFSKTKKAGTIPLHYIRKTKRYVGFKQRDEVEKSAHLIDTWKVLVPAAGSGGGVQIPDYVLGKPKIVSSPSVCTQSYLFFYVNAQHEAESVISYYSTRLFRFLVSLRKITQHATHSTYTWVPLQEWSQIWTDKLLYEKYSINDEEQAFIESQITEMSVESGVDE